MELVPFQYSKTEAEITAKWEIGVRNCTVPLTALLFVLIGGIEVFRLAAKLPFPPASFYIADVAAILIFLLALHYIGRRISDTAREIQKRTLAVDFHADEGWLAVIEAGGETVYRTFFSDIEEIEAGVSVVRLNGRSGAICLPRGQLPAEFVQQMAAKLGKERFKVRRWM